MSVRVGSQNQSIYQSISFSEALIRSESQTQDEMAKAHKAFKETREKQHAALSAKDKEIAELRKAVCLAETRGAAMKEAFEKAVLAEKARTEALQKKVSYLEESQQAFKSSVKSSVKELAEGMLGSADPFKTTVYQWITANCNAYPAWRVHVTERTPAITYASNIGCACPDRMSTSWKLAVFFDQAKQMGII